MTLSVKISVGGAYCYSGIPNIQGWRFKSITFNEVRNGIWKVGTTNYGTEIAENAVAGVTYEIKKAENGLYINSTTNSTNYAVFTLEIEKEV